MGGKGEIGSKAGEVIGVVAEVPTMDSQGKMLEKWRFCWQLVGLMWTEVQKPSLSTCRSISRKVPWEGEMVQVKLLLG